MKSLVANLRPAGLLIATALACMALKAQERQSRFEGMWSDPELSLVDSFCQGACMDVGVEALNDLLDDPANDTRSYVELVNQAQEIQIDYIRSILTPAALASFPLDPAEDPGFLHCEPWGVPRQILARHQLEIVESDDSLRMRYGEWAAIRTVLMDGRAAPEDAAKSPMGTSVGHFDSGVLVIETTGISAGPLSAQRRTSDRGTVHSIG